MGRRTLPRGLNLESGRFRIEITSRHTQPGRRYRERLPEGTTRREAEKYLSKIREADRLEQLLWPSERRPENEQPLLFGEFCSLAYLPYCEARNRPSTVERKKQELRVISPWFWDVPLCEIDPSLVARFATERKGERVRGRTVNIGISQVSHCLSVAHELGYLSHPPPRFKKLSESDSRPSRWLTEEQATEILTYASSKNGPWFAVVLTLLHTGIRYSELRDLRWTDLDLDAGILRVERHRSKGSSTREIPLLAEVVGAIRLLPRRSEHVFTVETWSRRRGDRGKSIGQVPQLASRGRRRYPWDPPGQKNSPHVFRHTFAHWRLQAGVSPSQVQAWLGHSSILLTVDTYGHVQPLELREEIGRGPRPQTQRLHLAAEGED